MQPSRSSSPLRRLHEITQYRQPTSAALIIVRTRTATRGAVAPSAHQQHIVPAIQTQPSAWPIVKYLIWNSLQLQFSAPCPNVLSCMTFLADLVHMPSPSGLRRTSHRHFAYDSDNPPGTRSVCRPMPASDSGKATIAGAPPTRLPTSYRDSTLVVFAALLAFRLVNASTLQTFFQPDEFFQSLEPAWQLAFGETSNAWITWVNSSPWTDYMSTSTGLRLTIRAGMEDAIALVPASTPVCCSLSNHCAPSSSLWLDPSK